jgi:hypothetical protein
MLSGRTNELDSVLSILLLDRFFGLTASVGLSKLLRELWLIRPFKQ